MGLGIGPQPFIRDAAAVHLGDHPLRHVRDTCNQCAGRGHVVPIDPIDGREDAFFQLVVWQSDVFEAG